jgi:hypothetical protein
VSRVGGEAGKNSQNVGWEGIFFRQISGFKSGSEGISARKGSEPAFIYKAGLPLKETDLARRLIHSIPLFAAISDPDKSHILPKLRPHPRSLEVTIEHLIMLPERRLHNGGLEYHMCLPEFAESFASGKYLSNGIQLVLGFVRFYYERPI